jgi:ABC-type lipoprotein export system ATPase subunit
METLLTITDLAVGFQTSRGLMRAVDGVSFSVGKGETVGLVGESGCGKSSVAFSILRLLPFPTGQIISGSIRFEGKELTTLPERELCAIRGRDISMIFQEPMSALNPVMRVGEQIAEPIFIHEPATPKKVARERAVELLAKVGLPNPAECAKAFPHELSGGMRQRAYCDWRWPAAQAYYCGRAHHASMLRSKAKLELCFVQREWAWRFFTRTFGLVKTLCHRTLDVRGTNSSIRPHRRNFCHARASVFNRAFSRAPIGALHAQIPPTEHSGTTAVLLGMG